MNLPSQREKIKSELFANIIMLNNTLCRFLVWSIFNTFINLR